jgi:putative oxidoreductase
VQRLFSTFADGWLGGGLLLLRLLAGGALVYCGVSSASGASHFERAAPHSVGAAAGVLLLIGLWTPVAGVVVTIVETWIALSGASNPWTPLALAILGASLAMIGPGAWSFDARIFGRKQINPDLYG